MPNNDLWKYCTSKRQQELLISLKLFGKTAWTHEKQIAALYTLSNHIENHYTPTTIAKRDGGLRRLFAPDPLLKKVQKNILHNILNQMPVSPCATAYQKGTGIIANAALHTEKKYLLKLDIENFFGTISFPMVYRHAFPGVLFPPAVRTLLTSLCCYEDYLPQGAPTSAAISNLVMKPFDEYIGKWCSRQEITYSRYCDDMTFSGEFDRHTVKNKVQHFLQAMGFSLNEKKTKWLTQHKRQSVTGIIVNQKIQVPAEYRKAVRKEIYYCRKYGVISHLTQLNDLTYLPAGQQGVSNYLAVLLGKVNFILQVNAGDGYFQEAKLFILKAIAENAVKK